MHATFSNTIFWLAAVAAVVGQVAIIWTVRPTRQSLPPLSRTDGSLPSLSTSGAIRPLSKKAFAEVAWAVLPAIGLLVILVLTWRAIHPAAS
jgi:hypothetical protein